MGKENIDVSAEKKQKIGGDDEMKELVEIQADDNSVFKVLKLDLTKNSEVFKSMFQHDTKENQSNIIKIKGYSSEIIQEFLKYIEIGEIQNLDEEIVKNLFCLADYYQIEDLKEKSVKSIGDFLSVDNFPTYYQMAVKFQCAELEEKCTDFMCENITIKTFRYFLEFAKKEERLNDVAEKVLIFVKSNFGQIEKSKEWKEFDAEFKLEMYQLYVESLKTLGGDELPDGNASLSVSQLTNPKSAERVFGRGDEQTGDKCSFFVMNTGKTQIKFDILWSHWCENRFGANPCGGILEPNEGKIIDVMWTDYFDGKACVSYSSGDSFVRQIPLNLGPCEDEELSDYEDEEDLPINDSEDEY